MEVDVDDLESLSTLIEKLEGIFMEEGDINETLASLNLLCDRYNEATMKVIAHHFASTFMCMVLFVITLLLTTGIFRHILLQKAFMAFAISLTWALSRGISYSNNNDFTLEIEETNDIRLMISNYNSFQLSQVLKYLQQQDRLINKNYKEE